MMTLISFLITIGLLVTVHEYGHFQVARWCNVKVLKFSIGFGKPLFRKKIGKDNIEFVIAAIPLGGYVKMLNQQECMAEQSVKKETNVAPINAEIDFKRAFDNQNVWKRMAIVIAGPVANLLLAVLLYWMLFISGVVAMRPVLGDVVEKSPADQANLRTGDLIKKVDGVEINSWQEARWIITKKFLEVSSVQIDVEDDQHILHQQTLSFSSLTSDAIDHNLLEMLGLNEYRPKLPAIISGIVKNSVADVSGLKSGDEIIKINSTKINSSDTFIQTIRSSPNKKIALAVLRSDGKPGSDKNEVNLTLTPESVVENSVKIGRVGVEFSLDKIELNKLNSMRITLYYPTLQALTKAINSTYETAVLSLKMLGKMLVGSISWKGLSGPVTIAAYAGQSAQLGWKVFLGFLATISISIGVLNLLPIPVLDGGHLMYYIIEIFKGSRVSERVMQFGQRVGFTLLGLLMVVAILNDFNNRFSNVF